MKKYLLFGILISIFQIGVSQVTFDWARHFGTSNSERVDLHIQDEENNVYLAGYFNDELDLNIGIGTDNVTASNQSDIFLAKFDSIGNLIWKFNSGENNPQGIQDLLIQDTILHFAWGKNKISTINTKTGVLISTLTLSPWFQINKFKYDASGNIILIGVGSPGIDLDPGVNEYLIPNVGSIVYFIASYTSNGDFNWANFFPDETTSIGLDIDYSKSRILTFGIFQNTQDFSLGGNLNLVSSYGDRDCFYAEFNLNGNLTNFDNFGSSGDDRHIGKYDSKGNIILFGSFSGSTLNTPNGGQIGFSNLFGLKIDSNFNEVWSNGWSETDNPSLTEFDFADSLIVYLFLQSTTSKDIYLRKVNLLNGNTLSKKAMYSFESYLNDLDFSIGNNRQIFISGRNNLSQVDYDPTAQNFSFANSGGLDAFVTVLRDCLPTVDTTVIDTCATEFTWSNGDGEIYNTDTISGPHISVNNDCEIISYLRLNISPVANIDLGEDKSACENKNNGVEFDAGSFSSYLWLPNNETTQLISVTNTGEYSVTVTDANGCQAKDTVTFIIHNTPVVNLGSDTAVCENENFGVEFDAGSFSSYSWLPNNETTQIISVTNAGEYSVTVTDTNGCEAKDTVIFSVFSTPTVDLGSDTAVCENDNNGVEFDAGSFSSYYWTPNGETTQIINATTSGDYIVFVMDANGCENRDTVEFTVYNTPGIDLGEDKSACENENYGVEFDAGSFNDYLWLPNNETSQIISVTTPGDYIVNVTDLNGCQASDTVSFTINAAPLVDIGNDTTIHIGETLTLDAGTHDSYEWQDASTDQTYEVQANNVGTEYYWVEVTNSNNCSDTDTVAITIDLDVGFADLNSSNFELFPNPTTGNLTISVKGNSEILRARIYDLAGKEVFFSEDETNINISNLERATYIIEVETTNGTNFQKLIKK